MGKAVKGILTCFIFRFLRRPLPDRKYRIDIAFPEIMLAIEVDGFNHHGKFLADFKRDRERQILLTLNGWRILRFSAGAIRQDVEHCLAMIESSRDKFLGLLS